VDTGDPELAEELVHGGADGSGNVILLQRQQTRQSRKDSATRMSQIDVQDCIKDYLFSQLGRRSLGSLETMMSVQ
jgi:hypothetical protein